MRGIRIVPLPYPIVPTCECRVECMLKLSPLGPRGPPRGCAESKSTSLRRRPLAERAPAGRTRARVCRSPYVPGGGAGGRRRRVLSPGLDNSTGNSTGTRQATRQDSSTATRQTSTDLDRNPLTPCARASRCQARQLDSSTDLDRPQQASTRGLRLGKAGLEPHSFKVKVDGPTGQLHNLVVG